MIYLSAEDDIDEVHRRIVAIANGYGVGLDRLEDLHIVPLAGEDAVQQARQKKSGAEGDDALRRSKTKIEYLKPALVVLDTSADLFGGDENDRSQVRQFVGMLHGWAIRYQTAVLLLSHPSLSGMATGRSTSQVRQRGITACGPGYTWSGSKIEGGFEADPDLRVLKTMKANYGPVGGEIRLPVEGWTV